MRSAASLDVAPAAVREDLRILLEGHPEAARLVELLGGCYDRALPLLRGQQVLTSLLTYGAVLDDVHARLDLVPVSRHATSSMVPIVNMTMAYRDGAEPKQLNLQVSPTVLRKLFKTCEAFVKES